VESRRRGQQPARGTLERAPLNPPAESGFNPPALLRNAHLQSILPSLPPRRWSAWRRSHRLRTVATPWLLDCGELGCLQAWHTAPQKPNGRWALLLHGWEGSADSTYVLSLGAALLERGYQLVRLNLRDHGGTQALNRELFHSCRLPEVAAAVRLVAERCAPARLYLAGFSLGGNFLLRVAAGESPPNNLAGVVAISPVIDPQRTLQALEGGWWLYHDYFVRRWARSLRVKQHHWPQHYQFETLLKSGDLRAMTAELVRQHTDFPSCDAYLDGYSIADQRLRTLQVPARVLLAMDDPIIPCADLPRLAPHPLLTITSPAHGGHCGFMDGFLGPGYADRFTVAQFDRFG